MSFSDWSNAKKKKKDNSTSISSNTSSFSSWSNAKHGISEEEENSALAWRNDEIAPVAKERTWFQESAAYKDGYQEGDFLKAAMGTGADASLNAAAGFLGIGEKVVDAVTTAGGWLLRSQLPATMAWELLLDKILGNDTDKTIERYKNQADTIEQDVTSFVASDLYDEHKLAESMAYDSAVELRENSVLGEKSDDLMYSAGQLVGQVAVSAIPGVGQVGGLTLAGANAFGSEAESAFQQGADLDEGMLSASVAAASEVITEKIGGISYGGKTLVDYGASKLSHKMTSKLAKNLIKAGKLSLDAGTEGVEELLSGYGSAIGQKLSYMSDKEIDELFTDEDKLESFIGGVVLGGGSGSVELATKGDSYITGLTKSEQAVVDKVYKDAIAEQEADGKTLSSREKSKIYDNIVEKMEKGDIDIDTIEEVLGGDTYKEYKSILDKEKSLTDEISQYEGMPDNSITVKQRERLAEARKELENIGDKTELKTRLSNEVYKIAQNDRLVESYNEKARKSQAFNADLTQYKGKQKEAVERAIKSGVLNNTNKAHALVNTLAKIEADKGIIFNYADNAKLKESGFALEGKTINGFEKNGTVTLNVQSAKAWQSTVGHEIGHILKGTDAYTELQSALYEYAESKGELASRKAELTKLYANLDADIDEELTCDLIGDYLFTDKDFINKLTGNRPLFKKIYDEVKYLCKVATGKELTEIEKVRKEFDAAWKQMSVKPSEGADGKVDLSVSEDSQKADTEYMRYVDSWNKESAQKMVDNAAKESGAVLDESGNPLKLYRGTNGGQTVFAKENTLNGKIYTIDNVSVATKYGDKSGKATEIAYQTDGEKTTYALYGFPKNMLTIDAQYGVWSDLVVPKELRKYSNGRYKATNAEIAEWAELEGYDALRINNVRDGSFDAGSEIIFFDENLVKSADAITKDNNGNTIPLSERFNNKKKDIRYSVSKDSQGNELSLAVQKRFANSKAVDENGNLKVLYHGTANGEFYTFDKSKGSVEGDFGSGFYFTDSEKDVKRNYEGGGPDFENKIARRAEQIEAEEEIDYIKARKKAIKELYVGAFEHKVYLNIENPAIVGETNLLDYDSFAEEYDRNDYDTDEDYESDVEYLIQDKIDEIIWDIQRNVDVNSTDGIAEVLWNAVNEGGIDIEQLKANINNLYLDDSNGNLVGNEVTRQIIESLGYDGIIDNTVSTKFNMGLDEGTTHYIVFKPNQIKSIDNQNPTDNPDIRKSLSKEGEQFAPTGNYSTPLNETALAPVANNTTVPKTANNEVLETEYDDAMYDDAPLPSDADVPPVMEDNYYAETDTTAVDKKALSTIGEKLRKILSLTAEETRAIQDIVQEYSTNENPNKEELYNKIKEKFGEKTWTERDTDLAKVKQFLKNSPLFLSDKDKADITDWSWFRKNMLNGKVKLSKDGLSVDKYYDQLVEMFPDRFGYGMSEEFGDLENQLNQIRKIAAVANEKVIKDKGMSIDDEYIQQAVDLISSEVSQYKQDLTRQAAEFTAQEALDSIAPLKATQLTDGTRGDALLNQSLDNFPIKTVEDKIAENIRAVEASLADTRQLRRETEANYDSQIAELEKRYANLKNKNTKKANNIVNSIVRLQRLKATSDAAYAKRISDLEARAEKMNSEQYNRAMHKQDKMQGYANWAADVIGDTTTWKDKKLGIQYETNTEHRNLRDIVRDANGNKDIAKADAIYEATMGEYNRNQAAKNRKVAEVKQVFADMKINHAESTYIQMLGEFRHNPDTTLTEKDVKEYYEKHKNKIDTAKVDKAIEEARKAYDTALTQLNAKLREQGMKEIPYRQGYFPHFTEPKQNFIQKLFNWKTQDNEIPTSIAGLTEDFKPNKSYQPFDKQRHGDKTDYNFLKGLDSYLDGAYDWVYHLEDIQKRRAIENHIRYTHSDEGIQARIKEVYANEELDADEAQAQIEHILAEAKNPLNNFVQDFMTHTNILAGKKNSLDRTIEQKTNRGIYSVMTNVQNRMSANMVLANVRSALTNFIPITQSWAQVSPLRSLQATKDTIANAIKDDGLTDKSTFLTNRLKQADNLYKTSWDKVIDGAGVMFEVVDNFSSQVIWRSKYNQNLADGMTESEAIANADQFAENVMAGRSKGNEPTIFNAKNPLVKAFTMFQLEVNNQYGYLFKDVPTDLKAETNHWKFNLAKGYTTAFIGAYAYNALMEQISGSGAALDPIGIIEDLLRDLGLFDDDEEKEPVEVVTNLIDNVAEELPFISGLAGGGRVPISSAIPYGDEYSGGLYGALEDISEGNWGNIGKELMNPILNVSLPVGGGQIKKTVQGLKMFNTDDEHPVQGSYTDSGDLRFPVEDTVGNRVQAAIFGQWANENARDYIENGRTPLNEKQIKEYTDVDLPIADYWEYREGLKGLKKNAEKADYINSLDIADWQKNLLMNNILDRKEDVDMSNYDDYSDWEEFDYAQKNPEKYPLTKAVGGYSAYKTYSKDLYNLKADKDADGKSISGSRKEKVIDYINNLDADYETKIILFKSEYPSDDTYNVDIINYINNRNDLTYEERLTIFAELGFTVKDGYVYWD